MKFLLDDGDQNVGRHCPQDSRLDGVFVATQELLDKQMLFDPVEGSHKPRAALASGCNRQWRRHVIVGRKDRHRVSYSVPETASPHVVAATLRGISPFDLGRCIAYFSPVSACSLKVNVANIPVEFFSSCEEGASAMFLMQSPEIEVRMIRRAERCSFDGGEVHCIYLLRLSDAAVVECLNCGAHIQQGVLFGRHLSSTKQCLFKHAQTQVDCHRVKSIYCVFEIRFDQIDVAAKFVCSANQHNREIRANASFVRLVGAHRRQSVCVVMQTDRKRIGCADSPRRFNVAHALPSEHRRKRYNANPFRTLYATNVSNSSMVIQESPRYREPQSL